MRNKSLLMFMISMLAVMLMVSACSNNSGNSGSKNTDTGKKNEATSATTQTDNKDAGTVDTNAPVSLSMMWWGADERHAATVAVTEEYTKQFPNVSFKTEYMAWDAFWQKLPTLAASKAVTDVLQMDAAYIQEYVAKGVLADLSDIDLAGIVDPNVVENLKIDGKLYGIPLSQNAQGIAFNKQELEAAGVALPQVNWTWDDYFQFGRDAASKLPKGKYGISDTSNAWDWYNWYQTGNGEKPLMSDGGKTFTLNKDLFVKYHSTLADLRNEGSIPPPDQVLAFLENDPTADPMASGVVMTRGATTGSVSALDQLMPGKIDVVNIPTGSAGGGWAQSTIFLSVSADSKNLEQSKAFVRWFIADQEAGKILGMTRGVPINPEVYAALEGQLQDGQKIGKKIYDVSVEKALPFYSIAAGYTEWVDTYKATMEGVMFGQTTIDAAYEKLNKLGQDIAAKAQ
jgi:multiple sugar transport system substrate-binding protein